jgi:hypothetical protein
MRDVDFHGKPGAATSTVSSTTTAPAVHDATADTARTNLTSFARRRGWRSAVFRRRSSAVLGARRDRRDLQPRQPVARLITAAAASLKPSVPVTELAQFGFAVDTKTSTLTFAAQAHVGQLD